MYLLTYRLRITDIKMIIKRYYEYYLCTFLNIKPKMCFNVTFDEECVVSE